jgi:hypothetical protein
MSRFPQPKEGAGMQKFRCFLYPAWLAVGLIHLIALSEGLQYWIPSLPDILSLIGAFFLCNIPIVSWVLTYHGAAFMWQWPWYWALALAAPQIIFLIVALPLVTVLERRR